MKPAGPSQSRSGTRARASSPGAGLAPFGEVFARLPRLRGISPGERACPRPGARRPGPGRAYDESRHDRPRGKRLRHHDQPRARLGRLPPRFGRASEQHARRVRPDSRCARPGRAHGEHDGSDPRARRRGPCVRCRRRGRDALARSARPGRDRHPRRRPRSDGGRRPAQAAPGGRSGSAGGRVPGRRAFRARGRRFRGPPWPTRHHYFGGVSVVTRTSAAGDPRRSGASASLPRR